MAYIDNVLLSHGGLPQVPPLDVHLEFFLGKFGGSF